MKHQIRQCTRQDFKYMIVLAKAMHQESPVYRDLPLDENKLLDLCNTAIDLPDLATLLVSTDKDGEITGMLGAVATTEFFGPSITTCDLFLYVKDSFRGSRNAVNLVNAYKSWAESLGATRISLGITTGIRVEETGGLFEALGFQQSGKLYTRNNPYGSSKAQSSSG